MVNVEASGDRSARSRLHAVTLGLGVGLAAGAVTLGGYGFVRRDPLGLHEASVRAWTAASLLLLAAAAVGLIVTTLLALRRADMVRRSAQLLAVIVAVTVYAVVGRPGGLGFVSPAARALLQLSWVVGVVAAVLVVAGSVAAAGQLAPQVRRLLPTMATALALGLVCALGLGALVRSRTDSALTALTATAIDIPAVPTTVGDKVAYAIATTDPRFIVPAGPGFVMLEGESLVGYGGQTGQRRWQMPIGAAAPDCVPTAVRSTGTAVDSVVIAQCRQRGPSSSRSSDTVLVGVDAMTGKVLWAKADNWELQSPAVTGPEVIAVLRNEEEVGALDPRTGNLLWTKNIGRGECGMNVVGVGEPHPSVAYFPICANPVVMHVLDGRTGTEHTLTIEPQQLPATVSSVRLYAAAGNVLVIEAYDDSHTSDPANLAVDIESGNSVPIPVKYLLQDRNSLEVGQYPGPVLQLTRDIDGTLVYLVAERRTVRTAVPTYGDGILDGQRWAVVGDQLVTATAATAGYRNLLALAARSDGAATAHPSPCGASRSGGVLAVPAAVLVVCARSVDGLTPTGYVVVGMR